MKAHKKENLQKSRKLQVTTPFAMEQKYWSEKSNKLLNQLIAALDRGLFLV